MFFQGPAWRKVSQQMIKEFNQLPNIKDSRVILAFSGGQDSVFLLAAMDQIRKKYRFDLFPMHIEHNILPEDKTYSQLANKSALTIGYECNFAPAKKPLKGENLEDWMRKERYRLLENFRKKQKAEYIAVAHHASDQAETVLAHIIRGTGIKGLKGMLPVRGKIIRPLLPVAKRDIEELMHISKLPYYEDKLNYSKKYQRNRIRHDLIPYLEKEFNPKITERLTKLAENIQKENL